MATKQQKPKKSNKPQKQQAVSKNGSSTNALQNHLDTYLSLFGVSPDPTILLTLQEEVVYVNPAFEETFGWTLEELVGNQIDFVPSECATETLLDDGKITGFTTKRLTKNGNVLDVEASGTLLQDENNHDIGSIIIYRITDDITPHLRADDALIETLVDQEHAASQLETVAKVSTAVSTILDPQEMLQAVVDLTKESFGFYHAHIYLLNEANDTLELVVGSGEIGQKMVEEERSIPLSQEKSLVARAARTRMGVNVKDVHDEPDFLPHPLLPQTHSELAVPLITGDNLLGVLDVQSETVGYFTQRDVNIQTTLASQVAVALQNARLYEQSQQRADELHRSEQTVQESLKMQQVLHETSLELARVESIEEFYQQIIVLGREQLNFERLGLYLFDKETGRFKGTFGVNPEGEIVDERDSGFDILEESLSNYMDIKQRVIVELDTELYDAGKVIGRGWHLTVPLRQNQELIGALFADHFLSHRPLKPYEPDLLASYGNTILNLLERKQAETTIRNSEQIVQESLKYQQILHETSLELAQAESVDELFEKAVRLGRDRLNFKRIGLYTFDAENSRFQGTFGVNPKGKIVEERDDGFDIPEEDVSYYMDIKQRVIVQPDTDLYENGEVIGRGWMLTVPLRHGKELVGALFADQLNSDHPLQEYQPDLLASYGNTIVNLLKRKQAEEAIRKSQQALEESLSKQQILHEINLELANTTTLEDLYRQAILQARDRLNFERIGLFLYDEENRKFVGTYGLDLEGNLRDESGPIFDIDEEGIVEFHKGFDLKNRIIVRPEADMYDAGEIVGRGWLLSAPVRSNNKFIGLLFAENMRSHREMEPYEPDLLASYSSIIGNLIERHRVETSIRSSEQMVQESLNKQQALHEVSLDLANAPTFEDLVQKAILSARDRLGFERIGLYQYQADEKQYVGTFGLGLDGDLRDERAFVIPEENLEGVFKGYDIKQQVVVRNDVELYDAEGEIGKGWHLSAPVRSSTEFIGLLFAENYISHGPMKPYQPELLVSLGNLIGNLIEIQQSREALAINEQHAREFQEHLKLINEIDHELSQAESLDEMYRLAIERGRQHLGFDRMGLFVVVSEDELQGTYGTDADGNIIDERHIFIPTADILTNESMSSGREYRQVSENITLYSNDEPIGIGWHIQTFLWSDDDRPMGQLVADGFLKKEPMKPFQPEVLTLYAATISHQILRQETNIALAEALAETERLYEMSTKLNATSSMEEIIDAATLPIAHQNVNAASLFTLELNDNDYPEWMEIAASWAKSDLQPGYGDIPIGTRFYIPDIPGASSWIENPEIVSLVSDVETDESLDDVTRSIYQSVGVKSAANLPLRIGDKWVGMLAFTWDTQYTFTSDDYRLYRSLAEQTAVMLNNQLLLNQTQKRATELAAVAEIGAEIATIRNVNQLLESAATLVKERFDLYHVQIYLPDSTNELLDLASSAGEIGQQLMSEVPTISIEQESSLIAQVARTQKTNVVNNLAQSADFTALSQLSKSKSELAVPIVVAGELTGVLDIHSDKVNRFSEDEIQIHNTVAAQIGVALQNARSFTRSEEALQELEEMTRRLRHEGWESYFDTSFTEGLGYRFDQKGIVPLKATKSRRKKSKTKEPDATFALAQPLEVQGASIGMLSLSDPESLQDEAQDIMTAVAERLSAHIENLRLTEQTQRALSETEIQARRLVILNEISTELSNATHLAEVYDIAVTRTAELVNADRVSLPLLLPDGENVQIVACFGEEMDVPAGTILSLTDTPMETAIQENRLITGSPTGNLKSTRIAPLVVAGKHIGTLNIGSVKEGQFDERDETLLLQMTTILSSIIENIQLLGAAQARAQREQRLREVATRIRGSADVDTIMRTAVQEIGQALGRQTFVRLGSNTNGTAEEDA